MYRHPREQDKIAHREVRHLYGYRDPSSSSSWISKVSWCRSCVLSMNERALELMLIVLFYFVLLWQALSSIILDWSVLDWTVP